MDEKPISEDSEKDGARLVKRWLEEIKRAEDREKDWRNEAKEAWAIYSCDEKDTKKDAKVRFNILHSNIETTLPAIYNSVPIPDIRPRYNEPGQEAKIISRALERAITYQTDQHDFDGTARSIVLDALLPGRGVARVRYQPYFAPMEDDDGPMEDDEGNPLERVILEEAPIEHVPWRKFTHGEADCWGDVPWVSFELSLTKTEVGKLNPKAWDKIVYDKSDDEKDSHLCKVYEIWCKTKREVLFVADGYEEPLKVEDDPLQLVGFFPTPRPILAIPRGGTLTPICPFSIYKPLADELDKITKRIDRIVAGLKARGIYATAAEDLRNLAQADDNELVPASNLDAFIANGGDMSRAIAWWPIENLIKVLQQLYLARDQTKATIYEVTGISDIVRGASQATETATAQQIKSQWGSLRIQQLQGQVARYMRDLFRLQAEVIASRFDLQTLKMITGIEIPPQIEPMLRDDAMRSFNVDIESDSTIRGDLTRNQEAMSRFLEGTAAFAKAMGPIVMQFPPAMPAALEVFGAFARQHKLGKQAEDALEKLLQIASQAGQQPQDKPDPQAEKAKADIEKTKLEADIAQKEHGFKMTEMTTKHSIDMQKLEAQQQAMVVKAQTNAMQPIFGGVNA